jgi:3-oxoacyl-[acyl-carrier protein] reductase
VKAPISNLGLRNGSRSGLTGFVAGLARSNIARRNVTINNLLPGAFDTAQLLSTIDAEAKANGANTQTLVDARRSGVAAGRFGNADEFGEICAFLCSVAAAYITGRMYLPMEVPIPARSKAF